jgi:hypothetical protein
VQAASSGAPAGTSYEAVLGTSGATGTISQAIATTAGQTYTVTFWLASDSPDSSNYFQALWGGSNPTNGKNETLNPLTTNGTTTPNSSLTNAFDYTEFQFTETATSASTLLAFNYQNSSTYHLTDISVNATPIPAAVWLFGSGLVGLMGLKRKYLG